MSVLNKISYFQNRRDEVPNKELAKTLAETENKAGIAELVANLKHKNKSVQSDCLAVLYHIGYVKPHLIADYVEDFLALLKSKNNRLVWGGMIALSTIAELKTKEICANLDTVKQAIDKGTLITVVWGVKAIAKIASSNKSCKPDVVPILLSQLKKCIPRDVAMHFENSLPAIDDENKAMFLRIVEDRKKELTTSQLSRLKKAMKNL
ncbi:hypothetical protein JXA31_02940 [Candidatus Bathyarchaeota archaeon]|nr:hypothetical protein [Candidatus Bathyarchaeota archaeon]